MQENGWKKVACAFGLPGVTVIVCLSVLWVNAGASVWGWLALVLAGLSLLAGAGWLPLARRLLQKQAHFAAFVAASGRLSERFMVCVLAGSWLLLLAWVGVLLALFSRPAGASALWFIVLFKLFESIKLSWSFVQFNAPQEEEKIADLRAFKVTQDEAPQLWALIDRLADTLDFLHPDHVVVGAGETDDSCVLMKCRYRLADCEAVLAGDVLYLSLWDFLMLSEEGMTAKIAGLMVFLKLISGMEKAGVDFGKIHHQMNDFREAAAFPFLTAPCHFLNTSAAQWVLFESFVEFFDQRTKAEIDRLMVQCAGQQAALLFIQWEAILMPTLRAVIEDFRRWKIASNVPIAAAVIQALNASAADAIAAFKENLQAQPAAYRARLAALGFQEQALPLTLRFSFETSAASSLPEAWVVRLEAAFLALCKDRAEKARPELEEYAAWQPRRPKKRKTLRHRGGFLGSCILLLSLMPLLIAVMEKSAALPLLQASMLLLFGIMVWVSGVLLLQSCKAYLAITPKGLWVIGHERSRCFAWEEIELIAFYPGEGWLQRQIVLCFFRPIPAAVLLGDPWQRSVEGDYLLGQTLNPDEGSMRMLLDYYHASRARLELEWMQENGWLAEDPACSDRA